MATPLESIKLRSMLLESLNSKVEIVTNFGLIIGEVFQIQLFDLPVDYVLLKESEKNFIFIPFLAINSLMVVHEEGDL